MSVKRKTLGNLKIRSVEPKYVWHVCMTMSNQQLENLIRTT